MIKNSIIHIHLSYFTSKIFRLFKNTTYNIKQAIFRSILFRLENLLPQIQWFKFNSGVQELQEKQ